MKGINISEVLHAWVAILKWCFELNEVERKLVMDCHEQGSKQAQELSQKLWHAKVVIKVDVHFCWNIAEVTDQRKCLV